MTTALDTTLSALMAREIDPAFAARGTLILKHLQPAGTGRILDLGCGRGFYAKAVTTLYPQATVIGVDYNAEYLNVAAAQTRATAGLARANALALPFASGSFEAIVCSEVLEHIDDDSGALDEMYRVLSDDGLLVMSVPHQRYPFLWDPLNWMLEHAFGTHVPAHIWWLAGIWADHVRLYTAEELSIRVETAGFQIENMLFTTTRSLPFAHFLLYGIGKNIIERGLCSSFNRFEDEQESSRLFAWARRLLYACDGPQPPGSENVPSVGIVLSARKRS
jgi:ubiquinone/menaquinone biosynthesis C-methylase UbiE